MKLHSLWPKPHTKHIFLNLLATSISLAKVRCIGHMRLAHIGHMRLAQVRHNEDMRLAQVKCIGDMRLAQIRRIGHMWLAPMFYRPISTWWVIQSAFFTLPGHFRLGRRGSPGQFLIYFFNSALLIEPTIWSCHSMWQSNVLATFAKSSIRADIFDDDLEKNIYGVRAAGLHISSYLLVLQCSSTVWSTWADNGINGCVRLQLKQWFTNPSKQELQPCR